jgi:hypothetical protein
MSHHDAKSFKKVAVLTGLTVLVGGAEISSTDAATILQHQTFNSLQENSPALTLTYNQFDPLLGTLTAAQWDLNSTIFGTFIPTTVITDTASFSTTPGNSTSTSGATTSGGIPFIATFTNFNANLPPFIGLGSVFAVLQLTSSCEVNCGGEGWSGSVDLTYTYDPTPSNTPLPAALPLFASGAAGFGFIGWLKRKVRKTKKRA